MQTAPTLLGLLPVLVRRDTQGMEKHVQVGDTVLCFVFTNVSKHQSVIGLLTSAILLYQK